jgi:hypothetical protein
MPLWLLKARGWKLESRVEDFELVSSLTEIEIIATSTGIRELPRLPDKDAERNVNAFRQAKARAPASHRKWPRVSCPVEKGRATLSELKPNLRLHGPWIHVRVRHAESRVTRPQP